ncbi:MAG: tetratricopeptide repeat protein [Bacteroidota bacterium]|nr:tetratricopeptide repeat protein [Bacteroidota bacterium]
MRNLNLKFFTVLMIAVLLTGCSENKKTEDQYLTEAKTKLDEKKYDESITEYREFIKNYPKSDKAIFAYNQIAGIQIENLKNPQAGIKTYIELAEKYPSTKEAKQALFMVAFMYDETLKDKDNAIKSYKIFLEKYPKDTDQNDKMSESARTMLEVLQSGKSIEEIIQQSIDKMGSQNKLDSVNLDIKDAPSGQTNQDKNQKNIEKKSDPNNPEKKIETKPLEMQKKEDSKTPESDKKKSTEQ